MQTWTAERIEKLTRLWAEGASASQIATELGGVSRNAVIGKVHRLKLAQRKTKTATVRRPAAPRAASAGASPAVTRLAPTPVARGGAAVAPSLEELPEIPRPAADIVPIFPRLTLMELGPSTCRWPIGDPMSPDFRFCGARTQDGATYCSHHACLAYQQRIPQQRQRSPAARR